MPHRLVGKDRLAEQVILDSLFMGQKLILVRGPAGVGKSLLLKRLAYALADRNFDSDNNLVISRHRYGGEFPTEYESVTTTDFPDKDFDDDDFEHEIESIIDELEPLPSSPVPIFYSLRMDFENIGEIEKLIGNSIYSLIYPDDNSRRYSKLINAGNILKGLFSIPGSKWVLLLDALDEVFHPEQNIPKIRTWLSQFPDNVQIIITLRPGINIVEKREEIFDIDTLGKQEILDLLKLRIEVSCEEKNIPKTRMKDEFDVVINWLENNRDIYEILKLNRALLAFSELITGRWDAYKPKIDAAPIKIEAYSYFSSEDISNEKNFPVSTANDVDIPAGTIFDGEITDIEKGVFEEASYVDIEPVFPVALALRQITTTMRHEERKRKPWVPNVDQHDDNARVELERSAWYSNWDVDYVNIEELRKDNNLQYLDWNKNLGFIYSKTPYQLGFINHLYKLYSTAEYACNCEVQTEISAMNRIAAVKVRELLDDLINL
jgi:GTPase SAR1 family protein